MRLLARRQSRSLLLAAHCDSPARTHARRPLLLARFAAHHAPRHASSAHTHTPARARARAIGNERRDVQSAGVADWGTARGGNTERALTAAAGPLLAIPIATSLQDGRPQRPGLLFLKLHTKFFSSKVRQYAYVNPAGCTSFFSISRTIRVLSKFQMWRVCHGGRVVRLLRMKRRDSPPGRAQTGGHDDPTFVTSAP